MLSEKELVILDTLFEDEIASKRRRIISNICKILGCDDNEILEIAPIKAGLTNLSFRFRVGEHRYVYRHPGKGTEEYINRRAESASMNVAKELNLDDTFIYIDAEEGWKLSHFIEGASNLNYHDFKRVEEALQMLRKLHTSGKQNEQKFDLYEETQKFICRNKGYGQNQFKDLKEMEDRITMLHNLVLGDAVELCLCHCDSYNPNFLIDSNGKMFLIDWEYSGMSDPGTDIGTFIACSDYSLEEAGAVIDLYLGHKATNEEKRHYLAYVAFSAFYWFVWALYQEKIGKDVGEYLYIWYRYTTQYASKAIELYEGET